MSSLTIENAKFSYGSNVVFQNINLQLNEGEICCLIGANGCGKSSLLDCTLGVNRLVSGSVFISGVDARLLSATDMARKVAYVPQAHNKTFPYTVRQIILMGRTAYTKPFAGPDTESEEAVWQAMTLVGVEHLADRPYTQISGGEMQLVLLARALAQNTQLILMDEPTAHLDFHNELLFLQTIIHLLYKKNTAILMATHSPNQAFYFNNQNVKVNVMAMIKNGGYYFGTPEDVLNEDNISSVYRVEAKRLDIEDKQAGRLRHILPIRTNNI